MNWASDYDRFHENGPKNDIALLRLARPVEISPAVNTLCLPPPRSGREDDYFEETVVIGWGKTDSGRNSDILQKLDLKGGNSFVLKRAESVSLKHSLPKLEGGASG